MPTNSAENVREFYRKQGEQREQERIIKLLETEVMRLADTWGDTSWPKWVIGLIKGENN